MSKNLADIINKVHCADCLEFMRDMPDGCVDLVITDPPYGINYHSGRYRGGNPHAPILNDDTYPHESIFTLRRIARKAVFMFCRWETLLSIGVKPKSFIVWAKDNWSAGDLKGEFARMYEGILFFPGPEFEFKHRLPDVLSCPRVTAKSLMHPTEKPVALLKRLIECCTEPSDTIFDPFLGSGTTAVAAKQLGRNFIGVEVNPEYCKIAEERLKQEVLPFTKPQSEPEPARDLFEVSK